ncbi:hypothetical protein HBI38_216740 [Parastagonospora nodorum]|nr:hypothetical protein HBH47_214820 [Parastagonospora nodorum]KAH4976946.1 hypothetical protein HBI76_233590 [Parastagonospora nodorum]KAH5137482.1 hypothetical protein HBH69_230470 [Parastagonospora nodorum]KAH5490339.1 hypothetical protein HBI52_224360 [Parastagonospora nodorum]KAH5709868.1 hypothetical protein HBI18_228470 [Parastagonospora nodorum]
MPPEPHNPSSDNQMMRDANFDNKFDFMHAHGLRPYETDDYPEAKGILDAYREADAREKEKEDGGKVTKKDYEDVGKERGGEEAEGDGEEGAENAGGESEGGKGDGDDDDGDDDDDDDGDDDDGDDDDDDEDDGNGGFGYDYFGEDDDGNDDY